MDLCLPSLGISNFDEMRYIQSVFVEIISGNLTPGFFTGTA
jgi:hypothetical protein